MNKSERSPGIVSIILGIVLVVVMTVALGVFGSTGIWVVAVLGGITLGVIAALAVVIVLGTGRSLRSYEQEPFSDVVTSLPSSQKLTIDLDEALKSRDGPGRRVLSLYLLDGLKKYNDAYGHACGDALLSWLAQKLRDAVAGRGTVYRMRGGEFAILARGNEKATAQVSTAATAALVEAGEGFVISCSLGEVILPDEAETASEALKLADHRAHAQRANGGDEVQQPREDSTETGRSSRANIDVAELALAVGRKLGVPDDQLDDLAAAAHLRDIGNMALPSAILTQSGELSPAERQFIRLHTLVGERLLATNFGMTEVAALVRSSHERWDGAGYPDGLKGETIPLGARIVFACSAFEDMTSARPYRPALKVGVALAELDRGAGGQFDPEVVDAFRESFPVTDGEHRPSVAFDSERRLRVLVADDDATCRFLLWRTVEAVGHDCVAVENGRQAWELYRKESPDILISDSRLPGVDGNELCRRIRRDPDGHYTYFVMLTALGDLNRIRLGIGAGADDFLTKPIVRQELDQRLSAAARAVQRGADPDRRLAH
jgi:diguanylate cyclase (GGDEF)-like protein